MQAVSTKKIIKGFALVIALVAVSVIGFAQQQQGNHEGPGKRHGGKHGGGLGRFASQLNLTDAQREQLKQIAARHKENTASLREQLRGVRRGTGDGDASGAFNEAEVRQAAQARAAAQVELEVAHARMQSEMFGVLTPEQRAQYTALQQQKAERRRQWQQQRELPPSGVQ